MYALITILFIAASLEVLLLAQKAKNPVAMVHILFFIIFVELLHLAGLFGENHLHYDIVYYLLAQLAVFIYLVIFVLGMVWLHAQRLIPPQEKFFRSAIGIGDVWLIAAFCGWLLMKAYLVMKYGVSAFSLFSQLAGKDAVLHFYAWWETPMEMYLRAFAMGACVAYVVKAMNERGYWKNHWLVSLVFMLFLSINIGTHSTIIGPRRFMLILVIIGVTTAVWRSGKRPARYLLDHWRKVLMAGMILFSLAAYYQSIRNNFSQPEIANKLLSGNLVTFVQGLGKGMIPLAKNERVSEDTKFLRPGPFNVIYRVIERRNDDNLGTDGEISANAFRMIVPRIIVGRNKEDINADDFLANDMSITPEGPYLVSDVATSILAIFMADFGFIGVVIAPILMVLSMAFFLYIPRKGLVAYPLMTLFYLSALLNLAANVEGNLVAVLSIFRDTMILAGALAFFSLMGGKLLTAKRQHSRIIRQGRQDNCLDTGKP